MSEVCVHQKELAARWKISHRTLERWRWAQEGPRYLKIRRPGRLQADRRRGI